VYRFRRAMPESPRPQARIHSGTGAEDRTLLHPFVGQRPSPEGDPGNLAVGAGFEPAMSWLTASCLTTWLPHKDWSGTSDLNRDSLGPRPSGLIRFPSPRIQNWSERLESNRLCFKQSARASETRALIRLSYAHTHWNRRPESNRHFFVRTEVFYPLNDARTLG
jgi:hypothetical protein